MDFCIKFKPTFYVNDLLCILFTYIFELHILKKNINIWQYKQLLSSKNIPLNGL